MDMDVKLAGQAGQPGKLNALFNLAQLFINKYLFHEASALQTNWYFLFFQGIFSYLHICTLLE